MMINLQSTHSHPVLSAKKIIKTFGPVRALTGVDFSVNAGEIVGLMGDNGAGKSTLIKCLSGAYIPDSGSIEIDGQVIQLENPLHARELGIETVFQDLALAPDLSITANIFLGRELLCSGLLGKLGFYRLAEMKDKVRELIAAAGITTLKSVDLPTENLSGGQRQALAIARARAWASKVLILDEPTAALGVKQRKIVMNIIRECRDQGMAVVVIAHDVPALIEVCDRLVILRHGCVAANLPTSSATHEEVVSAMLGAPA